ncbi:carbamoyltransferase C-terminal domain-containing protein [Roseomonas sp. CECT 9278]|uniref:carbamoyltransferase C-terminal domain-containing protein n=1 Tax=Roseomonas sp. CECT 9278 TaxID=2845823 RepID=UPI001E48EA3B|nr:carbamoyltransferase C-terminal domain-containing protein [Roseomonas sp. CECT 9278]CAH0127561.1 nebramycin 5' synthase [Roseomonas sp. CECT 9278]
MALGDSKQPTLLGFYLGLHDSNVAARVDGKLRYRKFERMSGIKHQRVALDAIRVACDEWGIRPDYVAFTDGNRNGLGSCIGEELWCSLPSIGSLAPNAKTYCLDHHYAHVLSAMPEMAGANIVGIAIDGRGDNGIRARVVRFSGELDAQTMLSSSDFTIGRFFNRVGISLGLSGDDVDLAGKVMGAQAYGNVCKEFVSDLEMADPISLPDRLLYTIPWQGRQVWGATDFFDIRNQAFLDWLASAHDALGRAVLRFFSAYCSSDTQIVYAGGCAQNTVFNTALFEAFPRLEIPPHAYDGGLSLGCIEFLRRKLRLPATDYAAFPFIQDDCDVGFASREVAQQVAELIAEGKIVGWMQGNGEIGPRALGHRSILMDPRISDGKAVLNERVKRREPWRPYAGSILEPHVTSWFETNAPSPYMLRAIKTREERHALIPGIVHHDGTCRIQTVNAETPELEAFNTLLTTFFKLTGVPLVLNTSLNAGGEPIHGDPAQSMKLLRAGRIDALCVGNNLLVGADA